MKIGDMISWEKVFTVEEVQAFTQLSGDSGKHHVIPDELGRLTVQGLLTATLPTKIGGDFNVLASHMTFHFLRPVFTGDSIQCDVQIKTYNEVSETRIEIEATFTCKNQLDKVVLNGCFAGIIKDKRV